MEALLFVLDSVIIVLMVVMSLRDDRRAPGVPHTSLFRMRDNAAAPPDDAGPPQAGRPEDGWPEDGRPQAGRPGWAEWDRAADPPR